MKKLLLLVLIALFGLMTGCGGTTEENQEVENIESSEQENTKETEETEEGAEEGDAQEFNQLIADTDNVKATLVHVVKKNDDIWGNTIEVKFEVENKREDTIEVQARQVSIDGKMVDETILSMSTEIAPGKLADAVLTINEFEGHEFPALEENLEMVLHIFSWDNMDFEEDHNVKIEF